jgi:hypothetical protein
VESLLCGGRAANRVELARQLDGLRLRFQRAETVAPARASP